ncbi:unnamed protein product [Boreogadus saida]
MKKRAFIRAIELEGGLRPELKLGTSLDDGLPHPSPTHLPELCLCDYLALWLSFHFLLRGLERGLLYRRMGDSHGEPKRDMGLKD